MAFGNPVAQPPAPEEISPPLIAIFCINLHSGILVAPPPPIHAMRRHPSAAPSATLLLAVLIAGAATTTAWGAPVMIKTTVATCSGTAGDKEETQSATFSLKVEAPVTLLYEVGANPGDAAPSATIRIKRKLPNGSFVTIKTIDKIKDNGQTEASSFPAGDYTLEVVATHASFKVTVQGQ